MSRRREGILREMGLAPLWRLRGKAVEAQRPVIETAPAETVPAGDERTRRIARMDWEQLKHSIAESRACRLC